MEAFRPAGCACALPSLKVGLAALAACLLAVLAAALPGVADAKTMLAAGLGALFALLLLWNLEWAYLVFVLLICVMPSRYNQMHLSLGHFHWTVYDPLLLALFAAWGMQVLGRKRPFRPSGYLLWPALMLCAVFISAFFAMPDYRTPWKLAAGLGEWLRFGVFFILTYQLVMTAEKTERFFYVLAASSLIVAAYGIYSYFTLKSGFAFAGGPVKAFSFEKRLIVGSLIGGGATTLAGFLILTMPMILTHALATRRWLEKLAFLGIFATQGIMLVLTFSRGGWMSLTLILFLILIMRSRKPGKLLFTAGLFLCLLLVLWRALPVAVHERLKTVTQPKNEVNVERWFIWNQALGYIRDSPLVGSGPNNKYNTAIAFSVAENYPIFHCHNLVLYTCVELGVLGAAVFFAFLIRVLAETYHRLRRGSERAPASVYGIWAGLLGFILHSQVDYFLWQPRISFVFWLMTILLVRFNTISVKGSGHARTFSGQEIVS